MERHYELLYFSDQWVAWRASLRAATAYNQFDGFLIKEEDKLCCLYECKVRNTSEAIWQMIHYARLLKLLLPGWTVRAVEVCRYYDPVVKAPDGSKPVFLDRPDDKRIFGDCKGIHFVYLA